MVRRATPRKKSGKKLRRPNVSQMIFTVFALIIILTFVLALVVK